jgi:hypothetical protein
VLQAQQVLKVLLDRKARQVLLEQPDRRVQLVQTEMMGQQDRRARLDHRVPQVLKVQLVQLVLRDRKGLQVHKAHQIQLLKY